MTTQQPRQPAEAGGVEFSLYRALGAALSPLAGPWLRARGNRGKEEPSRSAERFGHASRVRPPGTLIWVHGASVGECLAALPLIEKLLEQTGRHVLLTSGTVTSAKMMAERLPPRAFHQYVPLDLPRAVNRFLDHWQPDLALFIESELWPNLILESRARNIPLALVNARLSQRSHKGWSRLSLARRMLSAFDVCLAQDQGVADRLTELGARKIIVTGSLKADAPPLPVDQAALNTFRDATRTCSIFLAASTHPGEEEIALDATRTIRETVPNLLTVIVPRHPERGGDVAALARARGFTAMQRSEGTLPAACTHVYVADTMGELGLFYRAAPFAFLGGSLIPHGGQNPLEPARLGAAVLTGPHTENFAYIFDAILTAQGEGVITSGPGLAAAVTRLAGDPELASRLGAKARSAAESLSGALNRTLGEVEGLIDVHART
jgi:3-deoxy-D-manno-octulosonic-acid transferase